MSKVIFLVIFVCGLLCGNVVYSQYSSNYIQSNPYSFSIEDFNKISLVSTSTNNGKVIVDYTLSTKDKELICNVNFYGITLNNGSNLLNIKSGKIKWGKNQFSKQLIENTLTNGQFDLCVEIMDLNEVNPSYENCYEIELSKEEIENILNVTPIELLDPENKDTIKEVRPQLIWQPPTPTYQGTKYYLLLVEISDNLSCTESLNNNIPIIQEKNLIGNILNYPSNSLPLKEGKTYCWRVSAYQNEKEYTRSEDWKFTVFQKNKDNGSIPILNEIENHIEYIVDENDRFNFALNIKHNLTELQYEIIGDNNEILLTQSLQPIKLKYGLNTLELDLTSLNKGSYTMKIINLDNKIYEIKLKK